MKAEWDQLAGHPRPSWYLDPEVASQKRRVHQELIRRCLGRRPRGRVFKTDLFEDVWGRDAVIFDVFEPDSTTLVATDIAFRTVRAAKARAKKQPLHCFASDLRHLPIRASAFDAIISTSTLDHFATIDEFDSALSQLCHALKPGGVLVITLDNPLNPAYWMLRLLSHLRLMPFYLGYTPPPRRLTRILEQLGFQVSRTEWLIHNPRLLSTAIIQLTRTLLRRRADLPIRCLLRIFAMQSNLCPRFSACFYAVHACKPR